MNWRLMAVQVAFGCALWWLNLFYYSNVCYSIYPSSGTYCSCYNPALTLGSWQILYTLVARQYLTFASTIVILVASDVLLIVKLIAATKNRRELVKASASSSSSSGKTAVESRLTNNVIVFTTLYLVVILPYFLINTLLEPDLPAHEPLSALRTRLLPLLHRQGVVRDFAHGGLSPALLDGSRFSQSFLRALREAPV